MCAAVGGALVLSLVAWVVLKGLAQPSISFRSSMGAVLLGIVAALITRRRSDPVRRFAVIAALVAGASLGPVWGNAGVAYFSNLLGWLQDGSTLTLTGGLRGLGTRLTLWLALLGGSLATASGRHVTIDVVSRSWGPKARLPLALLGGIAAAAICFCAAYGFADFIARETFGSDGQILRPLADGVRRHGFILRRQLALDLKVAPRILGGQRWDSALTPAEWNAWLEAADWTSNLGYQPVPEPLDALPRAPLVALQGAVPQSYSVKALNLIVPFGLLMIGLRMLLWCLRRAPVEESHGASEEPAA